MRIFIDGNYYSRDDAKISVFDHGLLYGDGIFEGIRIYNGKAFLLEDHIKRFFDCAKTLLLEINYSYDEILRLVKDSIVKNELNKPGDTGYIRLLLTRGAGDLGLDPSKCSKSSLIIITNQITLYPEEYYENGIRIVTSSIRRNSSDSIDPKIKSLNYLNNILAKIEAKNAGCLEAIMLNKNGFVAECTADNIFILKNNTIYTPDLSNGALGGITRKVIFDLAEDEDIPVKESNLTMFDIYTADECFITGSGAEIVPVINVDGRDINNAKPGKITKVLLSSYQTYCNSYTYKK